MSTSAVNQMTETAGVYQNEEVKKTKVKGNTIGEPKLSEKAQKYYEQLKKKFSNMDFILVSSDMKESAQAQAGQYANPNKMVVLIDEEKIEKMAVDENYRKQYEGIIGNAAVKLAQVKDSLSATGASVKGYGMKVDDGGNASFFAVIDKSLAAQRERIEAKREEKAEAKKKAEKEQREERLEELRKGDKTGRSDKTEDLVTVTANSVEELLRKVNDIMYASMSDTVMTEGEKQVGGHIDYRG